MAIRIQLRRGTTTQWSTANPILADGEIGLDTTLDKFKIGDGTTAWNSLSFSGLTQSDLASYATTTSLSNHESDTTNIHGIADTATLATQTYADTAVSTHSSDTTNVHGILDTANIVLTNDARLSDSRTPTSHASSHGNAGSDPITISQSQVTNLTTDLAAKAPLASPELTGTPTAPTATAGTNTTQIATTAFVQTAAANAAAALIDSAPSTLDTLNELAAALGDDPNYATSITTALGGKEPTITAGTTSQYWRGDKSWQTLDKSAVGLGNVENTALSTWAGSSNITTVGTIGSGTWQGSSISTTYTDAKVTSVNGSTGSITGLATTSGDLSQFASTSSAQLAGVLSDETGFQSGAKAVFSIGPTITSLTGSGNYSLTLSGGDNQGGSGFFDFLRVESTATGATNPNKTFRLNSAGGIEIVNSAYNSVIFTIANDGSTIFTGTSTFTGSVVIPITTNARTASYTLVLSDASKLIEMNVGSGNTITVPPNSSVAFPIGTKIDIIQTGAGETSFVAGSGVTINSDSGKLKINAQWAAASLIKRDTNTWALIGALKA